MIRASRDIRLTECMQSDNRCAEGGRKFRFLYDDIRKRMDDAVFYHFGINIFRFEQSTHQGNGQFLFRANFHCQNTNQLHNFRRIFHDHRVRYPVALYNCFKNFRSERCKIGITAIHFWNDVLNFIDLKMRKRFIRKLGFLASTVVLASPWESSRSPARVNLLCAGTGIRLCWSARIPTRACTSRRISYSEAMTAAIPGKP